MRFRSAGAAASTLAIALALAGCLGGGDEDDDGSEGEDYALEVERITDAVLEDATDASVVLNRTVDGTVSSARAAAQLSEIERRVTTSGDELEALATPDDDTAASAGDLADSIDELALFLELSGTEIEAAEGPPGTLAEIAHANSETLLVHQSAISRLSRAVRTIAVA
jgi:hypothetical protein